MLQTTIRKTVHCTGIGLHSGKEVELTLRPASENTGVLFSIRNGSGSSFLSPNPKLVVETGLATTLGNGHDRVATVEHLLAAIRGLHIDNIQIEVRGGEVPIMDGSAASFVYLLNQAGVRAQGKPRRVLALKSPLRFEQDGRCIEAAPHHGLAIDYTIDFDHPLIGTQRMAFELTPQAFAATLAKARTFGFMKDVDLLHQNGLALGGSLDNAVVLDEYAVLNAEGLRFEDEFVRHKILDFIGDMAIVNMPLYGRFTVFASGHAMNNAFLRYLDENRDEYLQEIELPLPQTGQAAQPSPREAERRIPAMA
jgi:UDP-3-O-[3-hydroxymyristoyl] N-acetylglucosamine deacetylase